MFTHYNPHKFLYFLKSIFLFLLIFSSNNLESQFINKFGLKGGVSLSKITLSSYIPGILSREPEGKYKLLTVDLGLFAELFDSRYFCVSTEIHYTIKGEESFEDLKVIQPNKDFNEFNYKSINDRFSYLSFQILPRYKFIVNSQDKIYIFGGPKFDLRISNNNSLQNEEIKFSNGKIETGIIVGIGNEIWDLLFIEGRYEYNFTDVYTINYDVTKVSRKNTSFNLLIGISLKKLLKIHF